MNTALEHTDDNRHYPELPFVVHKYGKNADELEAIIISGSTKTSKGYKDAVNDALDAYEKLKGEAQ